MHKYIEGETIGEAELKAALRRATLEMKVFPVICGTAFKNKGVQPLLDAVIDYLPSPLDVPPVKGIDPDTGKEDERAADDKAPFSALAFKIMTDPFVGQLTFIRVYSGQLKQGDSVLHQRTFAYGAHWPPAEDARQQARRHHRDLRRRHLRVRRTEEHYDRRHHLRRRSPDRSGVDRVPGAGNRGGGRAEDQERSGKDGSGAGQAGAGRSHLQGQHRSRQRPDDHRRHGRAAPGNPG